MVTNPAARQQQLHFFTLLLFAAVLPWFVQPSTYWRDGPEFILSAFFLDISHPPGSPAYAQLIHPLTWLPIGTIAARVHLSSALIVVWLAAVTMDLARNFSCNVFFSIASAITLLFLPGVMHQALTAEVYTLSAVVIFLMVRLIVYYENSSDVRALVAVAFLAGLGSGVHVIVAIAGAVLSCITLCFIILRAPTTARKLISSLALPIFLSGVIGLFVWFYLPARALQNPPLNTGSPVTAARFWGQLSNARDRDLRPNSGLESFHLSAKQLLADGLRITNHTGAPLMALSLIGFCLLTRARALSGACLTGIVFLICALFAGWDFAPFAIIAAPLAIACCFATQKISRLFKASVPKAIAVALLIALVCLSNSGSSIKLATDLRLYEEPASTVVGTLSEIPSGAHALIEQSYFLTSYIQAIENFRPDIQIAYQPAVEWPDYFAPQINPQTGTPYQNLAQYLNSAQLNLPITFEPSPLTIRTLGEIANCTAQHGWFVQRPLLKSIADNCGDRLLKRLSSSRVSAAEIIADEQNFREQKVLPSIEFIYRSGKKTEGLELAKSFCEKFTCSEKARNARELLLKTQL